MYALLSGVEAAKRRKMTRSRSSQMPREIATKQAVQGQRTRARALTTMLANGLMRPPMRLIALVMPSAKDLAGNEEDAP